MGAQPPAPTAPRGGRRRLELAAALFVLIPPVAFLLAKALLAEDVPFFVPDDRAGWILYPRPLNTDVIRVDPRAVPVSRFRHTFTLGLPSAAVLHVRALGEVAVSVNGSSLPLDGSRHFRRAARVEVGGLLRPGRNELSAEVSNPRGPALLHLWVEGLPQRVATDGSWEVALDSGPPVPAQVADDTRMHPESFILPTPWQSLLDRGHFVLLLAAGSAALFLVGRANLGGRALARLPRAVLWAVTAGWSSCSPRSSPGCRWSWASTHPLTWITSSTSWSGGPSPLRTKAGRLTTRRSFT